jgi:Cdc6-like AAA superfamily ATPase
LIGLRSVKEKIHTLVNTMKLELANPADNARKPDPGKYVFLGNPGTGKTEVARLFGRLLYSIGLLSKGHLVEVKREDLVAGVIGQTAQKTLKKCKEALGGVLLIDEAYSLIQYGDHGGMDFGREALDTILIFMEDNRHSTCVIFAGYPDRMEGLIEANPAIQSRISRNNFIDFPDYSAEELSEILKLMIEDRGKKADEEYYIAAESVFAHWTAHKDNSYGNAREVRNLVQDSVQQAANRLLSRYENPKDIPKEEYNLLVRADLEANYLKLL